MKVTMTVIGMTCEHCEKAVNDALVNINGVYDVSVNIKNGTVNITYVETDVTIRQMKQAIEDLGYDVVS